MISVFCESSIRTYIHGACWNTFKCNFILKFEFGDLERSRSTGEDLEIVLCGYITMKMKSDHKFNVVIAFKISAVACYTHPWVAIDTHMGVDLLDKKFEWRRRDLVGRGCYFCMPGHRLILRPMSKPGGALPARYTHCCICACPCSACCGFGSLLWGEY